MSLEPTVQVRNLCRLRGYFKDTPANRISQIIAKIYDRPSPASGEYSRLSYNCGCFGAHVARCLLLPRRYERDGRRVWDYMQAIANWKRLTGISERRLTRHGAPREPFGVEEWLQHPHDVLHKVIEEILTYAVPNVSTSKSEEEE